MGVDGEIKARLRHRIGVHPCDSIASCDDGLMMVSQTKQDCLADWRNRLYSYSQRLLGMISH
jgi:hypothetical protein